MSTANPEFLQVWSQVRQWPVELRQDLVEEITKSVETELPASNGDWDEAKNARRCELIDKEIQGALGDKESVELKLLTHELRLHRRLIAPLPLDGATNLHRQLLEKKRRQERSTGEEL